MANAVRKLMLEQCICNSMALWYTVNMKRKQLWVDLQDEEAAGIVMRRYGCESESAAFRLAVRVLAESPVLQVNVPASPTHARRSPKYGDARIVAGKKSGDPTWKRQVKTK